jgi:hypothetical protein
MLTFLAGLSGFCLAGDVFDLFVWFELMGVSAYALPPTAPRNAARSRARSTSPSPTAWARPCRCVLVLFGLTAGILAMLPRFAAALESAAARFEDPSAYASLVLNGVRTATPTVLYPQAQATVTAASVITALCSVAGAVLLALIVR